MPQQFPSLLGAPFNTLGGSPQSSGSRFERNKQFFGGFHRNVLGTGRQGTTPGGETVTMNIIGVNVDGKEYLLPSWDPDTSSVMTSQEAVRKFMPAIRSGQIVGYDSPEQAEMDRRAFYPEIVGTPYNRNDQTLSPADRRAWQLAREQEIRDREQESRDTAILPRLRDMAGDAWRSFSDVPIVPGSRTRVGDVPGMAATLGPGLLEFARYQPLVSGDVAEAAHFGKGMVTDPEYRREFAEPVPLSQSWRDALKVGMLPISDYLDRAPMEVARGVTQLLDDPLSLLPYHPGDLNEPQIDALATLLPGGLGATQVVKGRRATRAAPLADSYPLAPIDNWYSGADFQRRGGAIVNMAPDTFLESVSPLKIDDVARENIDELKRHILDGGELDPLELFSGDKLTRSSDGRHRAIAAKELGIDEIPVLDFRNQQL